MKCLYLTRSTDHARQLKKVTRTDSIRIYRTSLAGLRPLLAFTGARVIVVDLAFAGNHLPGLLWQLSQLAPHCSLVVAAPEIYADFWEYVIFAGGFDLILIPFHRQEAVAVLRGAHQFAMTHLNRDACALRIQRVLSFIRDHCDAGSPSTHEISPFRTAYKINSAKPRSPSFFIRFVRWLSAVCSLMFSKPATSLVDLPSAINCNTSRSRSDNNS